MIPLHPQFSSDGKVTRCTPAHMGSLRPCPPSHPLGHWRRRSLAAQVVKKSEVDQWLHRRWRKHVDHWLHRQWYMFTICNNAHPYDMVSAVFKPELFLTQNWSEEQAKNHAPRHQVKPFKYPGFLTHCYPTAVKHTANVSYGSSSSSSSSSPQVLGTLQAMGWIIFAMCAQVRMLPAAFLCGCHPDGSTWPRNTFQSSRHMPW